MCHVSHVYIYIFSYIFYYSFIILFYFFLQIGGASRWMVCYQRAYPVQLLSNLIFTDLFLDVFPLIKEYISKGFLG